MTVAEQAEHTAERPSWDCRVCGKPWPCDPAREQLISEMDRVSLAIYMWCSLDDAVRDMPAGPPADLFERFIRWTHTGSSDCPIPREMPTERNGAHLEPS